MRLVRSEPAVTVTARSNFGRSCDRCLLAADRQACYALSHAAVSAQGGRSWVTHSREKPMSFPCGGEYWAGNVRFPFIASPSAATYKPSMVANAFLRCQLARLCVTVGGFRESSPRRSRACAFGCSPKFSTPSGKNCGNSPSLGLICNFDPVFGALHWGETAKTR